MGIRKYIYIVLAVLAVGIFLQIDRSSDDYSNAIDFVSEFTESDKEATPVKKESTIKAAGKLITSTIKELVTPANGDSSKKNNNTTNKVEDTQSSDAKLSDASQKPNGTQHQNDNEQKADLNVLPVIKKGDVRTVDFTMLTKKGKINIVDFNGSTYLDITSLANWYGRTLGYDYEKDQFICILFGTDFRGESFGKEIYINGRPITLSKPIYVIDNKPYIPANAFAEGIGAEIILSKEHLEVRVRNIVKVTQTLLRS